MKKIRFGTYTFLLITISILFSSSVFAQRNDILVEGNPPFTRGNFESIVKYYERGLGIKFSDGQRNELQSKITTTWRQSQRSYSSNLNDFIKTVERLNTIADDKIKSHQQEFTDALLADLKTMSRFEWSSFIISIYENNLNGEPETSNAPNDENAVPDETETSEHQSKSNFQPITGAVKMSELVGKWNKGTVSSYGYRNTVTNDYRSGYGSANMHEIYANGSFDYSNFAQVSGYGCTTELFTNMKGRVSMGGSQISFSYVSGTVNIKDSCKKSSVDKPAQINKTTYRLERDGSHLRMCEIGKEASHCLYKEEK